MVAMRTSEYWGGGCSPPPPPPPAPTPLTRRVVDSFFIINSGKQCRIGYIIGATMVGLLAGTMLSLSIFYGITAQQAAARSTKEIYMSANETYNITDGHQSYMLQKVCIRTERNNIDWTIMKGRCSVKDETRIEDTIKLEGSIDEKKGYLFYLLRGSVFHIEGNIYVCQSLQS